jgi:hypothetical protein
VTERSDLDVLLAHPARAAEVPAEDRQAVLDALAVFEGRCRLVRELLTASLTGPVRAPNYPVTTTGTEAGALTQEEAGPSAIICRCVSFDSLRAPGVCLPTSRGAIAWCAPATSTNTSLVAESRV